MKKKMQVETKKMRAESGKRALGSGTGDDQGHEWSLSGNHFRDAVSNAARKENTNSSLLQRDFCERMVELFKKMSEFSVKCLSHTKHKGQVNESWVVTRSKRV